MVCRRCARTAAKSSPIASVAGPSVEMCNLHLSLSPTCAPCTSLTSAGPSLCTCPSHPPVPSSWLLDRC